LSVDDELRGVRHCACLAVALAKAGVVAVHRLRFEDQLITVDVIDRRDE
jgi:hypothetical protein